MDREREILDTGIGQGLNMLLEDVLDDLSRIRNGQELSREAEQYEAWRVVRQAIQRLLSDVVQGTVDHVHAADRLQWRYTGRVDKEAAYILGIAEGFYFTNTGPQPIRGRGNRRQRR
jgi:hypothetical protein